MGILNNYFVEDNIILNNNGSAFLIRSKKKIKTGMNNIKRVNILCKIGIIRRDNLKGKRVPMYSYRSTRPCSIILL